MHVWCFVSCAVVAAESSNYVFLCKFELFDVAFVREYSTGYTLENQCYKCKMIHFRSTCQSFLISFYKAEE